MFTIGCDPEVMLVKAKGGGLVSAIPFYLGTKEKPEKINGGIVSHDNVNVEFGTDPAKTHDEWLNNLQAVIRKVVEMAPVDHTIVVAASANFPDEALSAPEARMFGCDPDFDAYELSPNPAPDTKDIPNLRSCGGHIHVGSKFLTDDVWNVVNFTKALDVFLGIPSVLLDKDPSSQARRNLYGKAGCHRPKPYGVEYRTLSNFWVSRKRLASLMYNLVSDAYDACVAKHLVGIDENAIQDIINSGDKARAAKTLNGIVKALVRPDVYSEILACKRLTYKSDLSDWLE